MADTMTSEQRHNCMSKIRGKDTKPEMLVRRYLHARGLRYRIQVSKLPGKPDIVLPKYKTVIFVNGCFWHGHEDCQYFRLPKTNIDFWQEKIERNVARDQINEEKLRSLGWRVLRVWECELRNKASRDEALNKIYESITTPQIKEYSIQETDIPMAAEPETGYLTD